MLHIRDEFCQNDMVAINTLNMVKDILVGHVGGQPGPHGPAQAQDGTDAIVLTIFNVMCCISRATGCCDITLGIAGPQSPNKSSNPEVKKWRTRIFMRGVTAGGSTDKDMIAALEEIMKEFGVAQRNS